METAKRHIIYLLISIIFAFSNLCAQTPLLDSLKQQLATMPDDTNKLNLLEQIGTESSSPDSVIKYSNIMEQLAVKLDNSKMLARAYNQKAWANYCTRDYVTAYMYDIQSIDILQQIDSKYDLATVYMNHATTLEAINDDIKAIDYYKLSLDIFTELKDTSAICMALSYLGGVCISNYMFTSAYNYINQVIDIATQYGDTNNIADGYMNMGLLIMRQFESNHSADYSQLNTAINYLLKAYDIMTNHNVNFVYTMQLYPKISDAYLKKATHKNCTNKKQALDSCLIFIDEGLRRGIEYGYDFSEFQLNITKVRHLIAYKKLEEALTLLKSVDENILNTTDDYDSYLIYINECYIDYYQALGNYKKALEYSQKQYDNFRQQSVKNIQVKLTQTQMQTEFDLQLRQRNKEEFERELMHRARESRQFMLLIFFSIAFIALMIFAIIIHIGSLKRKQLNEQLNLQNEELEANQEHILEQTKIISKANKDITASIRYAKHIQEVAMPSNEYIKSLFPDSMVFFRPRDIVSGDFYWVAQLGKYKAIAVVDCTGHGVPGAFMSMLGISILNDKFSTLDTDSPTFTAAHVLNIVRDTLRQSLRQRSDDYTNQDGMDMAFCILDTETNRLQYAGAFRPLLLIRHCDIFQYEADRMPISSYMNSEKPFTNNTIEIKQGDVIYMYTDGITDQFGGQQSSKFSARRLRDLLLESHQLPFEQQQKIYEREIDNWMKPERSEDNRAQTDDMLLVGIRF